MPRRLARLTAPVLAATLALGSLGVVAQVAPNNGAVVASKAYVDGLIASVTSAVSSRLSRTSNLSDLASASAARTNLGLGSAATAGIGTGAGQVPDASTVLPLAGGTLTGGLTAPSLTTSGALQAGAIAGDGGTGITVLGRTLAARANDVINIRDVPALTGVTLYADIKQVIGQHTIAAGSSTLTVAGGALTAADIGKAFVLSGAGASRQPITGTITGVPSASQATLSTPAVTALVPALAGASVASPGGGYVPGDGITLAGGTATTSAAASVMQTQASAVAINNAGAGLTNGTRTFTVSGGATLKPIQFTGTVSGGAIVPGSLVVTQPGVYDTNPTLSGASVSVDTGSWTTAPTFNLTMGVYALAMTNEGVYTALPSGTGALTQASTTGSGSGATFTPQPRTASFAYGHDDAPAFAAALAALPATGGQLTVPPGGYGLLSPVTLPDARPVTIAGPGRNAATLYALAPMTAMIAKGSGGFYQSQGQRVTGLTLDGLAVATTDVSHAGNTALFDNLELRNVAAGSTTAANFLSAAGGGGSVLRDATLWNQPIHYPNPTPGVYPNPNLPAFNLRVYGSDGLYQNIFLINAGTAGHRDTGGGNNFYRGLHAYGNGNQAGFNDANGWNYRPTNSFWLSGHVNAQGMEADGVLTTGFLLDGDYNDVVGLFVQTITPPTLTGVTGVTINGSAYTSVQGKVVNLPAAQMVSWTGTQVQTTTIAIPGATTGTGGNRTNGAFADASGYHTLADGDYGGAYGQFTWTQGAYSTGRGRGGTDNKRTFLDYYSGYTFATSGDNQRGQQSLSAKTTSATGVRLLSDSGTLSGGVNAYNSVPLPLKGVFGVWGRFVATTSAGATAVWEFRGGVNSGASSGALTWVGGTAPTLTVVAADSGASALTLTLALDQANNSLSLIGAGGAAYWRGTVHTEELIHP